MRAVDACPSLSCRLRDVRINEQNSVAQSAVHAAMPGRGEPAVLDIRNSYGQSRRSILLLRVRRQRRSLQLQALPYNSRPCASGSNPSRSPSLPSSRYHACRIGPPRGCIHPPRTLKPAPPTQVSYAGTASGLGELGQVARTRFEVPKGQTVYARVAAHENWGKFHYLEVPPTTSRASAEQRLLRGWLAFRVSGLQFE